MRWMLLLGGLAGLAACARGQTSGTGPQAPLPPGEVAGGAPATELSAGKLDLPAIPARIEVTTSAPTEGTAPDKRSPILDVMKAENERELAALGQQKEPAYYLAYQLVVEQQKERDQAREKARSEVKP